MLSAKRRADSFFGMHFDFHALPGQIVAEVIDREAICTLLDTIHPDYIQIDTKGHPGLSSYPTEVGHPASEIRADMLAFWRAETKKRGIALYAHHSGLFDMESIRRHPNYAVIGADGTPNDSYISCFSPYVDEILIPQMKELAGKYELDGIWVDGDAWGVRMDYGPYAQAAYGNPLPLPGEPDYENFRNFTRKAYEKYVQHYIDVVKQDYPEFQITSNWMYSHMMTEKPWVSIDFTSGDYDCSNSVASAQRAGRFMAASGLPWDLMSWGQSAKKCDWRETDRTVKECAQYCQEAAVVIALGGGFEFFNIIYGGGGSIQKWALPTWQKVSAFCRAREELCYKSTLIPQVGVLYNQIYPLDGERLCTGKYYSHTREWLYALQDHQQSSMVIYEYQATLEKLAPYKLIILPQADTWQPETIAAVKAYLQQGGKVIAEGASAQLFADITGISINAGENRLLFADGCGTLASMRTDYFAPNGGTAILDCYTDNFYHEPYRRPAAVSATVGNGQFTALSLDISGIYSDNKTSALSRFLIDLLQKSGYRPDVHVQGSRYADVTLARKNGAWLINLVNCAGGHNQLGTRTFDEIPPIGPLTVSLRCAQKPTAVTLEPEGQVLPFTWDGNHMTVTVPRLEIHSVVKVV